MRSDYKKLRGEFSSFTLLTDASKISNCGQFSSRFLKSTWNISDKPLLMDGTATIMQCVVNLLLFFLFFQLAYVRSPLRNELHYLRNVTCTRIRKWCIGKLILIKYSIFRSDCGMY